MNYVKLALGLVTLLSRFVTYLSEQKLLKAGEAQAIARLMKEQADAVERAAVARERAAAGSKSVTGKLPDDGFRRG